MNPINIVSTSSNSSMASHFGEPGHPPSRSGTGSDTSWSEDLDPNPSLQVNSKNNIPFGLFGENVVAKVYRSAVEYLDAACGPDNLRQIPQSFPEIVPQQGALAGTWEFRDADFWTCGFFPGTLYALLERSIKHPHMMGLERLRPNQSLGQLRMHLAALSKTWSRPLHGMTNRTDTHDIGFIVMPALQREWELTGNTASLQSIIRAAQSLATRYIHSAGVIRSWDCLLKKDITITSMEDNALVIIDSLCNLDLLFYAAAHSGDQSLAHLATSHARTMLKTHLRPEAAKALSNRGYKGQLYSTCHVANIDPRTGELKCRYTAQGYSTGSTWARGQAWAILGYAQTYLWTKDEVFLEACCGVAEYFLLRLQISPKSVELASLNQNGVPIGRFTPLWDFDAPVDEASPLRDSSAGMIAANGMLILSQALSGLSQKKLAAHFRDAALRIARDVIDVSLARETVQFSSITEETCTVEDANFWGRFDSLLKNGTANNNENARRRYADHGLVYGDYYMVEFGNRLLNFGLV